MRLAGSSPGGPTCPSSLDKTALSSLGAASFGAPIALGVMACKEGQEGGIWAERPSDALPSPPAVHTCSVFPLLLCTLGVCNFLLFQGSPSLFSSRCGRVVSVLKEPPWYPWGPDLALDRVLSQGALTGDSPQPPALPGQASLTSESCFFPLLTLRLYRGKQGPSHTAESARGSFPAWPILFLCVPTKEAQGSHPTPGEEESPALTHLSGHGVALIHRPPHWP